MKIKIKTVTIDQHVNVHDDATVGDLKNTIEEIFGISLSEQTLRFNSCILNENNKLLADYEIHDGSEINLIVHFSKFNVFVSIPGGSSIKIEMSASNKISELKVKIQAAKNIPFRNQVILYKGEVAEDFKSLAYYGISNGSLVCVIPKQRSSDKNIILQMVNGQTHTIHLVGTDDVPELKQKIFDKLGIEKRDQILKFKNRTINDTDKFSDIGVKDAFTEITLRRIIDDEKTVEECEMVEASVIGIIGRLRSGMQIIVKTQDGKKTVYEISKNDKIGDLKPKIQSKLRVDFKKQELVFQNQILKDDKTIEECGINDNSLMEIVTKLRKIQIIINTMGNLVAIVVMENVKISDVKIKLKEKIEINLNDKILFFNGEILEDDKTVEEFGIDDNAVINVVSMLRAGKEYKFLKLCDLQTENWKENTTSSRGTQVIAALLNSLK